MTAARRVLVLGGARSGKSTFAEASLAGRDDVDYLATSATTPHDPEWVARVAAHRLRRPPGWRTLETLDVAGALAADAGRPLLVDCLTVWLARAMDECGVWDEQRGADAALRHRVDALVAALGRTARHVVCVSNEVGMGVVPATASGRRFRDEMGVLNSRVAAASDEVWFVVAGLPRRLK